MKYSMLGDANNPGPVRLSDVYDSDVGGASAGVAASQKALYEAYNSLNSSINTTNTNVNRRAVTRKVYFDDNTSHYVNVGAYGFQDFGINVRTVMGVPDNVQVIGFSVLVDRNQHIIVAVVSNSGYDYTFRFHNPTNTTQKLGGIVCIIEYFVR